ncbi:ogr/Delta-like zinc finger family protein [Pseudomonas leptonychotis]|uniref:Transcriptional regulator n=1 Tax=Pseudomonas leptonychotis TaxID=2448482 RepID=A0A4T2A1B9_9PSED|nr:ogr/Delta-like zinc finger family protein [Pseudomonas leptonychotis]TIH10810.1 transcriptional regulator [Pseudomonas leptonychotis]
MSSYYRLKCPKCQGPMKVRASTQHHIFLRVMYLQCQYVPCSWAVKADFQMTHELAPSGKENPAVSLPIAPHAIRAQAERDNRETANTNQLDLLDAQEASA